MRRILVPFFLLLITVQAFAAQHVAFVNRDWEFSIYIRNADQTPINVTGMTFEVNLYAQPGTAPALVASAPVGDGALGRLDVSVPAASMTMTPGNYTAEIVRTDTGADVYATWQVNVVAEGQTDGGSGIIDTTSPDVIVIASPDAVEVTRAPDAVDIQAVNAPAGPSAVGTDGDRGDIIVSGSGTVWELDLAAVEPKLEGVLDLPDLQGVLSVSKGGTGNAPGAADQVLVSDSTSAATWRTVPTCTGAGSALQYDASTNTFACGSGGAPGGSDTMVQYNDGGAFGGDAGMVYDEGTGTLTLAGAVVVPAEAYNATNWNADTSVPQKDAVRDELESASFLAGDVDGARGANDLDETAVEAELEGVLDVADLQGFSAVLTEAEAAAAYQPLDADLTSWAAITRASGFDTFATTPSSANLAALVTNETGSGALVFGTAPDLTISATTETNIEAALDTLANVTSIGGDVTAGGDFISTDDLISGDDLLMPSTGVINWASGDVTLTHATDFLTLAGGRFQHTFAGDDSQAATTLDLSGSSINNFAGLFIKMPAASSQQKGFQIVSGTDTIAWASFQRDAGNPGGGSALPGFGLGAGGSTARDIFLYREAARVLGINGAGTDDVAVNIDDQGQIRLSEADANGTNYKALAAPATITATTTCTLLDQAAFIPSTCVDLAGGEATLEGFLDLADLQGDLPLGSKTSGDYVDNITEGTGIDVTGTPGEGWEPTVTVDLTEISAAVIGNGTTSTLQVGSIELGAATDTTIARSGAGAATLEGSQIITAGNAAAQLESVLEAVIDLPDLQGILTVAKGGTGAAPGADDQALISDSSSAATWRSIPDCAGADETLNYDADTNAFSCGSDAGAGGGLANVVEDTSPQLGGFLDWNGQTMSDATLTDTLVLDLQEDALRLTNDAADGTGVLIDVHHDSASPADGDLAAQIRVFAGADDEEVGRISYELDDGATTTEDGRFLFHVDVAGTSAQQMVVGNGVIIGTGTTLPGAGALRVDTIELGADSDTTLSRSSAGIPAAEGVALVTISASQTLTNKSIAAGQITAGTLNIGNNAATVGTIELANGTANTLSGAAGVLSIEGVALAFQTITLTAGNGLTGGGDLSANRSFAVGAGTCITSNADDVAVTADCIGATQIDESASFDWTGVHTFDSDGVQIDDTNASHQLVLTPGSDLTADRVLTLTTGDSARTVTISGNATISQDYSTAGNPQFATIELGAASDTTLSRSAAGVLAVEGVDVLLDGTSTVDATNLAPDSVGASELNIADAEAEIEGAIDTLANLTSVQGLTVTLADAGADAFLGWDDSAAAYENLTDAEAATIIAGQESILEGVLDVADLQGYSAVLTEAEAAAAYQPLDSDLTSWAGVTRASGFDTWVATPSSANLATLVTDETGSGALVFGTAPQISTIELGHASDTTLSRAGAGVFAVEGVNVLLDASNSVDQANLADDSVGEAELDFTDETTPADGQCVMIETGGTNGSLTTGSCGGGSLPADPGAHTLFGWDDTGNAYVNKSAGAGLTVDADSLECDAATESAIGCVELATTGEAETGTDTTRAITAAGLLAAVTGKKPMWIPAGAMAASSVSGAACGTDYGLELATNDPIYIVCNFSTTGDERAEFQIRMPDTWNEGTLTFRPLWTTNDTSEAAGTVVFTLSCVALSDDDEMDTAFGTAQSSSDVWIDEDDLHIGPESAAITCAGTPAAGDLVAFRIIRDNATDNAAFEASLIGITVYATDNAFVEP